MQRMETIENAAKSAGLKNDHSQTKLPGFIGCVPGCRNEILGRLHGATLTEQVVRFMERYKRTAGGLR